MGTGGSRAPRRLVVGALLGGLAAAVSGCERPTHLTTPTSGSAGTNPVEFPEGPLDTASLLPYGGRYRTEDGRAVTLDRVAGPPLDASGEVAFADPGFFRYEEVAAVASFTGPVACELGMFAFPATTVDGRDVAAHRRAATVAFGDVAAVERWEDARDATGERLGFGADAGTGALYDVGSKKALDTLAEDVIGPLFREVIRVGFAAVVVDGRTAAVMFDCGVGDGWYPAYLGHDPQGSVVAVAADLELHHHLTRLTS
ncbi:DUF4241 domain-containing protein [Oryzobacter telluris]|uniref:DUF4241 domain-containing protein n=1 Tax=Oryzobacter telluris TaxID=3149179 RepID=UPI00370D3CA4